MKWTSCVIEAAIHGTKLSFEDLSSVGRLMIDASNALNCLNRSAAIHNIRKLSPLLHQSLENTCQTSTDLIIDDNEGGIECIQSDENDPEDGVAAIQMYGISIQPLIDEQSCKTDSLHTKQAWYADDASPTGAIEVVELDMCTRS